MLTRLFKPTFILTLMLGVVAALGVGKRTLAGAAKP